MTATPDVQVRIDDRVRLMASVLALTATTDEAHARRPHSAHSHARSTRRQLAVHKSHLAVTSLQALLHQRAPFDAIFGYALRLQPQTYHIDLPPRWAPAHWDEHLLDFMQTADLQAWWQHEQESWLQAESDSAQVLTQTEFQAFLKPFIGTASGRFVFMPNICYPAEHEIGVKVGEDIWCITPPRPAWGDSAPWPFDEEPSYVIAAALGQYARTLVAEHVKAHPTQLAEAEQIELPVSEAVRAQHPDWMGQFLTLIASGLVAIYLEDHFSATEARGYTLMESKYHGNAMLPGVVSVLRRYLADLKAGKVESFGAFLPMFPKQLRVAKRIYSL
jgi:hypothetical protein